MKKESKKVVIIDYGVGNIASIVRAVRLFTDAIITYDIKEIQSADALILPGVGSFPAGMQGLKKYGLITVIREFAKSGKPILGICLGAQLLLGKGYEMGEYEGLNLIEGEVKIFPELDKLYPVPNIGWRNVFVKKSVKSMPIIEPFKNSPFMYFVHSYTILPTNKENVLAWTNYGGHEYCAFIGKDNVYGTQFHPEISGKIGLEFIERFINLA